MENKGGIIFSSLPPRTFSPTLKWNYVMLVKSLNPSLYLVFSTAEKATKFMAK